jgi:hypothetical protein
MSGRLVENDFQSLTIFIGEFDLNELVNDFDGNSIPELENRRKIHSIMLFLQLRTQVPPGHADQRSQNS